jgi:hypothetical protein
MAARSEWANLPLGGPAATSRGAESPSLIGGTLPLDAADVVFSIIGCRIPKAFSHWPPSVRCPGAVGRLGAMDVSVNLSRLRRSKALCRTRAGQASPKELSEAVPMY